MRATEDIIHMTEYSFRMHLPSDRGMVGRECPACARYFKLKPGTGLPLDDCRCPYCGHQGEASDFITQEQLNYAQSVAMNELGRTVLDPMIRRLGRDLERTTRNSFLQIRVHYDPHPLPISHYQERQLETDVTCSTCRLEFAVYGVFATCPDCGRPNALDVFHGSVEVSRKLLLLLEGTQDEAVCAKLLASALADGVSAFDALGKALRARHLGVLPARPKNLFQNLKLLGELLARATGPWPGDALNTDDYAFLLRGFQVRHIFEHNAGVVDAAFSQAVPGTYHLLGRKYALAPTEVERFLDLLPTLADAVMARLPDPPPSP